VAALVGEGVRTFSIGFEDAALDESAHARRVASWLRSEHHHFTFDLAACLDTLDRAIGSASEPLGDPACLPVFLLAQEARRHVTVVLSGEGADETFGGYGYYPRPERMTAMDRFLAPLRRRIRDRTAVTGCFYRHDHTTASGFPMLTSAATRDELVVGDAGDADPWLDDVASRVAHSGFDALGRAQLADLLSWLPDDLLPKLDRMTMAASLEARAPFLEHRLATLGLALASPLKGGHTPDRPRKWVLRQALRGLLPDDILRRDKQGFVLPLQQWFTGPLRERILDELEGDLGDGLDAKRARDLALSDLEQGAGRSRLLFALLAHRVWFRRFRDGVAR
jgi:asparagine synthase (glutamine-hydrolysing)